MKISIYNENCVQAGRSVGMIDLEQRPDSSDWTTHEGTPKELLALAESMERTDGAPGRANQYDRRCAETIRQAVYFERPDLEPEEEIDEDE